MRVVLVDPGPQVPCYDRALARALAAAGDAVTLATGPMLYDDLGPTPDDVSVVSTFGRLLRTPLGRQGAPERRPGFRRVLRGIGYPAELAAFVAWAVRDRPAVVHWQWALAPPADACAVRVLRRSGVTVVYTAHNVLPHESRPWHAPFYRHLYRHVGHIIVHSEATRRRLVAWAGIRPEHVWVVPMPAEPAPDPPRDRRAARARLGLPVDAPLVLFFGHVRPYKGIDVLLDAWPAVRDRVPSARLVIAGTVAGGSDGARRLWAGVIRRGLSSSVAVRPGYVPGPSVPLYMAAADVVALPYRAGDDSAVVALARGHGRAVVTTDVGGLREALRLGGGIVVPPGDAGALADALSWVLAVPVERARLEAAARAAARAWTWSDVAVRTRSIYALARAQGVR
jgi:glycosyltransferase involved in cell wall biosynthesis